MYPSDSHIFSITMNGFKKKNKHFGKSKHRLSTYLNLSLDRNSSKMSPLQFCSSLLKSYLFQETCHLSHFFTLGVLSLRKKVNSDLPQFLHAKTLKLIR